jgi:prevent-host-death family protein
MERIGVRELRQHASRYLARVARGEVIEVTDRGRPVARLVPVGTDEWAALLASGAVHPPAAPGDLLSVRPADLGVDASGELRRQRQGER